MVRRNWTREELIVAFNLYCKIPFGRIHIRNPLIIELAKAIGRTPSALSWKLANFARLDPALRKRNIAGAGPEPAPKWKSGRSLIMTGSAYPSKANACLIR